MAKAGLSLPQAGAIIGAPRRTMSELARRAPHLVTRTNGQARVTPASLPALLALREDGLARRNAAARRAILIRWGKI